MDGLHNLLKRQLKHHFGANFSIPEEWRSFINSVNEAYREFDSDRTMLERSLELSSQELIQANAETRSMLKLFPDAFLWLDQNGNILNYKSYDHDGSDYLQGVFAVNHIKDIGNQDLQEKLFQSIRQAIQTLSVSNIEFSLNQEGKARYYEARVVPPLSNRILVLIRDITLQKEAENALKESEDKYRTIFESASDVLILLDNKGKILEINNRIKEIMGYDRESIIGADFKTLTPNIVTKSLDIIEKNWFSRISGDKVDPYEIELIKSDGAPVIMEVNATVIRQHNQITGYLVILKDITERKRTEDRIHSLYEQEKTQRLELEEEAKARAQFINVIAHELRTPLTPLLISVEMIRDQLASDTHSVLFKMVNNAVRSTESLKSRLEELLDLARFSRGVFTLRPQMIEIKEFIEAIALKYQPALMPKRQKLIVNITDNLPKIEADPTRIEQVLINLLSNASKYSPEDTEITLKSSLTNDFLQIVIRDQGIGISPEDQKYLFMPYHRVEQDRQSYPGIGLGLAVCKQIVEAHGGHIGVESEAGQGCAFIFTLPLDHE